MQKFSQLQNKDDLTGPSSCLPDRITMVFIHLLYAKRANAPQIYWGSCWKTSGLVIIKAHAGRSEPWTRIEVTADFKKLKEIMQ